jgi:hypothetical protein
MAKKIRVWDGSAWQDVAPALPYTAVHSAQASMPSTAVDGQIWLDTDASVPSTTVTRWYKLPSAGTTTLSGNDDNSIPLAYTPGYEQVFLNGTLLSRSAADYTATTGTSVVLSSAIVAGDIVEIICPLQITTTDTYAQSATNSAFQANTNNFAAGKNKIINGDFRINQRNASSVTTYASYIADRFFLDFSGGSATCSLQQFAPGAAPVAGYEGVNYVRLTTVSQSSTSDYASINQRIEDVRTLAGQTITVSFWAKASTGTPNIGWGCDFNFGSGGSAGVVPTAPAVKSITTSWARYSFTTTLPSFAGKAVGANSFMSNYIFTSVGTATSAFGYSAVGIQNTTIDIWGIQLESGSNATAFQTATGTLQGELAACQRYYFRNYANAGYQRFGSGLAQSTTLVYTTMNLPVEMRVIPTAFEYPTVSSNFCVWDGVTITNATALSMAANSKNIVEISATVASGLTQYRPYYTLAQGASTSAYIGVSAEL